MPMPDAFRQPGSAAGAGRRSAARLLLPGACLIMVALSARVLFPGRSGHHHAPIAAERMGPAELVRLLGEDAHAAAVARDALIARLGAEALPHFSAALTHPRPSTRAIAVEGIVELLARPDGGGGSVASPALLDALRGRMADVDSLVRLRVVEGIRRVDPGAALPLLLGALQDEDEWIREVAARELGALRAPESVGVLVRGLADPYPAVVGLCAAALRRITGEPIAYRFAGTAGEQAEAVAAWKRWWARHRGRWPRTAAVAPVEISESALAPPFALRDVTGRRLRLAELRGRIVLLNFMGSWCAPCVRELPGLANLQRRYGQRGFQVIDLGVSEKSEADLRRFAEQQGLPFPVALAPEPVLLAYGDIHEVPVSFLIDREGRIRRIWQGDRTERTFETALLRLFIARRVSQGQASGKTLSDSD